MKENPRHYYFNNYNKRENFIERSILAVKEHRFILSSIGYIRQYFSYIRQYFRYTFIHRTFLFHNEKLKYSKKLYNSIDSERVVEIPIVKSYLKKFLTSEGKCLEVGNVLNHYFYFNHDIIDKYEVGNGIRNEDIALVKFEKCYDLIISISTLEHVGFDEPIKEHGKIRKAIDNLINALCEKGKMIITVPVKYNPEIDELLQSNPYNFKITFLKRDKFNIWSETNENWSSLNAYGSKFPYANAIAVIEFQKS
ncbi:hypothetical protein OXIME_000719 [Oxyplasma meridianum]|uniref:Class I SAM-dependent methyltransferase n=1 Tax=Oxyplasma meridianum TaxID=3073602 RepID=A0AAX4NFQ5_9ARCH